MLTLRERASPSAQVTVSFLPEELGRKTAGGEELAGVALVPTQGLKPTTSSLATRSSARRAASPLEAAAMSAAMRHVRFGHGTRSRTAQLAWTAMVEHAPMNSGTCIAAGGIEEEVEDEAARRSRGLAAAKLGMTSADGRQSLQFAVGRKSAVIIT